MNMVVSVSRSAPLAGLDFLPSRPGDWGALTARERDVAALIALGLTNRQIAAALVLTEGTVANHVHRMLPKLGFGSRTQIAAWIASDAVRRAYRPDGLALLAGSDGPAAWAGAASQVAL
jgi:DNA-binding NarL/FixJ family response regulator